MQTDSMMISKIKYIHEKPVKHGYVDEAAHWYIVLLEIMEIHQV